MIDSFKGRSAFLSNFHASPVEFEGATYPTVEHAFQAAKTLDGRGREKIRAAKTPKDAKRLGRSVRLRPDWENVKFSIMGELLRRKFAQPGLRQMMLQTGRAELVEGNTWHDKIWGRCFCPRCNGRGANQLGRLLMAVRDEIRHAPTSSVHDRSAHPMS